MQAHGLETANEVALFELANAQAVVQLVEDERIACDLAAVTTADVFVDGAEAAKIKKLWDAMSKLDCPTLRAVSYHGPGDAPRVTGVKGAQVAFAYAAHTLWPYKLVLHLLAGAVAHGANLQTRTPVRAVAAAPDAEGCWALATPRGTVRARRVVFATNAYTAGLLPEYDDAIYAARATVCRVVPSPSASSSSSSSEPPVLLGSAGLAMRSPSTMDSYYGLRADGSLVVGGAKSTYFYQKRSEWYRNYDDATLIEDAVPYFDGWAERTLDAWEGKEEKGKVDRVWTGIMGVSLPLVP